MVHVGVWDEAIGDRHLKRLGKFLAEQEKGWEGKEDFDHLEQKFLEEPWLNWVKVVMVADPQNSPRPFVLMSLIKEQPHMRCSFYKLTSESGKEVVRLVFKQTLCTHFLPRSQRLEML